MSLLLKDIALTPDSIKRLGFFLKIEEIQLLTFLAAVRQSRSEYMFDIGANVGFYSLITAKYFPHVKCKAFEPTPDTFLALQENIENCNGTAEALRLAISSAPGCLSFNNFGNFSGKNGVADTSIHDPVGVLETIVVDAVPLDSFPLFGERVIVKIDTEGHELAVISGGKRFFRQNSCVVQIETGHSKDGSHVLSELAGLGYQLLFSIGPDQYFSNIVALQNAGARVALLEFALALVLRLRWGQDVDEMISSHEPVV